MKGSATLPLGIDIGTTRVRVAAAERRGREGVAIAAVAVQQIPNDAVSSDRCDGNILSAVIDDLRREVASRTRHCVLSLHPEIATLRVVRFPKMTESERRRAAQFEAERASTWNLKDVPSVVRSHWINRQERLLAIGIAREKSLKDRLECVRRAGLRVAGIDHDACALQRAFPYADAVLDVGYRRSALHAFSNAGPVSALIDSGGADVTRGISLDLGIDGASAEKRKRILGTAGAGEHARGDFVERVSAAIERLRKVAPVRRVAIVGNGGRLPGLAEEIEFASRTIVDAAVSDILRSEVYPEDVLRSAAPDWTLAAALATWSAP